MSPLTYATRLTLRQYSTGCYPGVISSQPTPRLGMTTAPLFTARLAEDSERLRGGGIGFVCSDCWCNNQELRSPIEPAPNAQADRFPTKGATDLRTPVSPRVSNLSLKEPRNQPVRTVQTNPKKVVKLAQEEHSSPSKPERARIHSTSFWSRSSFGSIPHAPVLIRKRSMTHPVMGSVQAKSLELEVLSPRERKGAVDHDPASVAPDSDIRTRIGPPGGSEETLHD